MLFECLSSRFFSFLRLDKSLLGWLVCDWLGTGAQFPFCILYSIKKSPHQFRPACSNIFPFFHLSTFACGWLNGWMQQTLPHQQLTQHPRRAYFIRFGMMMVLGPATAYCVNQGVCSVECKLELGGYRGRLWWGVRGMWGTCWPGSGGMCMRVDGEG